MENKKYNVTISQTKLPMVLFIVFLVLKLTHNIDWSWWWVTSPLWIGFVIVLFFMFVFGGIAFLYTILRK